MICLITEHKDQIFLSVTLVKVWSEHPCLDRKIRSVSGYTKPITEVKQKQIWETLWYSKEDMVGCQKTGSHWTQHTYVSFEKITQSTATTSGQDFFYDTIWQTE